MAELSKQYLAGLFDGEGCVQFNWSGTSMYPKVLITNTRRDLLEKIQQQFGGNIRSATVKKANWKQAYHWCLSWSKAVEFLDLIRPWLNIKDCQADTVFAWSATRPKNRLKQPDQESWYRTCEFLKARLDWLNRRGPVVGEDPAALLAADPTLEFHDPRLADLGP